MNYTLSGTSRTSDVRVQDVRSNGGIPAVLYGNGIQARSISVVEGEFVKVLRAAGFSSLIDLVVDGSESVKVLVKQTQKHPTNMKTVHIDFYQVRMDQEIETVVPLEFVNESDAVKVHGGTLVKSADEIEVRCLPGNLPPHIDVDLSKLHTFDDAITIGDLILPSGVEAITEADVTIATVARPLTEEELKKMEETEQVDVSAIVTEGEEKRAEEEAKKAEETSE